MKRDEIKKIIENDPALNLLKPFVAGKNVFLAGGFLRDLILTGKVSKDRDIVTFGLDTEEFARNFANGTGGAFVELDTENKIYRVVFNEDYFDIAQGLDSNINKDIDRRDFTINSIFYDLNKNEFYDKNKGLEDLEKRIIQTFDLKNLSDDPLRMLRAFRFKAQLGFEIDKKVLNFIKKNSERLKTCAKERIQQEIVKMFQGEFLVEVLLEMLEIGLLETVFPFVKEVKKIPPNSHHHLDLIHHLIETVRNIRINKPLLKLAAFYHDIGKPCCWTIEEDTGRHRFIGHDEKGGELVKKELAELKFSKKQIEYVSKMVKNHIYPSSLIKEEALSDKAIARFIRRIHPDIEDLIEIARADRLSARGEAVSDEMVEANLCGLDKLLNHYNKIKDRLVEMPKLTDGKEIMEILKIKPGPKLGKIIEELKEAQIQGIVQTKEEAVEFIKKFQDI